MMARLGIALTRVGRLALWALLLSFLALVAIPRFTTFDVLVVRGGSMEPAIHLGSVVVVDRGAREPAVGSISSFRDPDSGMVTHRVVAVAGGRYVTRGDANRAEDATRRPPGDVYGTVVLVVPAVGFVIHALQLPAIFLLLLVGTGGLLVLGALRTIVAEVGRIRRQRMRTDAD
jgi:signal peptidase